MIFAIVIIALLAVSVLWLFFRSMVNRSYVKGRYKGGSKPKKWELKSDGHIEAEEAVFRDQMKIRYEYYNLISKSPPEIRRAGDTVITADDFAAAQPIFDEYARLGGAGLKALAVLSEYNYKNVWYLSGLSDIVKAAIFEQSNGNTLYMPEYGVLVCAAGDVEGFRRELSRAQQN